MKGIRKLTSISKPPRVCLPITTDILQGINTVLLAEPDSYLNKMRAACCMAFFGFLHSSEFTVAPSIITTLRCTCHYQISHWIEGIPPIQCVYILNSPKLTLLGRVFTFIWSGLTSRFAQLRQLYPILQYEEAIQGWYSLFVMEGCLPGIYLVQNLTKF